MSKLLQLRGGTTSEHSSFTGAVREVTVDTTKDTLVVHDGSTAGGFALPRTAAEVSALISNDAIDSQHYAAGSIDAEHLANDSVTTDKVHLISTSSTPSLEARSDGTTDGYIQLNCTANSHGIKLKSPPHSAGASYTLVFPHNDGDANQVLTTDGSGIMSWAGVGSNSITAGDVNTAALGADAVTGAKIADNAVDSEHYAAGSIDLEHMSSESVDEDNLHISNAGSNGQYLQKQTGNAGGLTWGTVDLTTLSGANLTSGIIPTARINASSIANDLIDSQHLAADSIDAEHYAAGSVDTAALGADSVTTAKIADSVALGGSPTTTTQSAGDNTTKVATTAYTDAAIAALADTAPAALNTLNELAAALGDDANYAATTTTAIGLKAPIASPTFTGNIGMPNASIDLAMMNVNSVDSDQYVDGSIDAVHIAANTITAGQLAADCVGASELANNSVGSANIIANSITAGDIAAGAVGASEIGNDVVNSQHYAAGSIDNEHINTMAASKLTGALPAISGANLTGVDPFPSGTVMVFYQSAAPTGWTKSTAQNDKALRVVSGSGGGTGGTHDLSSPPSLAHTHTAAAHTHTAAAHTHTSAAHTHGNNLSAAAHTLTEAQMPSHRHAGGSNVYVGSNGVAYTGKNCQSGHSATGGKNYWGYYTGGGQSHSHGMSGSVSSATPGATGSTTPGASGSTTPTSFAPKYINVIICAKD